jgi:signal transduction histidine kinase
LADKVITALSEFAKLPYPQVRPVPIEKCVTEALEICDLPPAIQIETNLQHDLPAVLADPDQLRIVLTNLIRNARDAMPEGGRLSVTAAKVDGLVEIAIADTGVGIPAESLRRIMEPLYSTKARGLGLGLAITRAIVEKHHGEVRVISEQGDGSTFTVRLPAALAETQSIPD